MPLMENYVHEVWLVAIKLIFSDVNSFSLEYSVVGTGGKPYLVNLLAKSCSCRFFDIKKDPCVHGIAAYILYSSTHDRGSVFVLEDLVSKYY